MMKLISAQGMASAYGVLKFLGCIKAGKKQLNRHAHGHNLLYGGISC